MANYIPSPRLVPQSYRLGIYELPDTCSFKIFKVEDLPSDWGNYPYPLSTQKIGSEWLVSKNHLFLFVPRGC